jgi:hypothetical protein
MADLEQNLDGYRILAQILIDLRNALHAELERYYGHEWYRAKPLQQVLNRLIERKEHEQAIDWYESEYQQIIDFATFEDLLEVLEADSRLLPELRTIAPSTPLLHARLMEMETMRQKLALARVISENELVFLGTFHLRFRKVMESASKNPSSARETAASNVTVAPPANPVESAPVTPSSRDVAPPVPPSATARPSNTKIPKKPAKHVNSGRQPPAETPAQHAAPEAKPVNGRHAVMAAMDAGDDKAVLESLYREVTAIAEGLWEREVPATPSVWPRVREHAWYEKNFSPLGLQPLSDFYDVIDAIHGRIHDGLAKDELQAFLKEHNFAKILLALRDMFQKNQL